MAETFAWSAAHERHLREERERSRPKLCPTSQATLNTGMLNHVLACDGCNLCVADWVKFSSIRGKKNRLMWRRAHMPKASLR